MALPDGDSSVGHSFGLEFDGITIKAITYIQDKDSLKNTKARRAPINGLTA